METAYLGLGANLGDAQTTLNAALAAIAVLPQTQLLRRSSWYRSRPVDSSGPDYLNAVAEVRTALAPLALLDALQSIELQHGRERPYRNAPRTLDLDLLLYGDRRVDTERLVVPHPRMAERAFVLLPLLELQPALAGQVVAAAPLDLPALAQRLALEQGIERVDEAR
jgi:2-amino-4-hydroxy-6-hydroxymethyldihydropteridine diphosphokinase